MKAVEAVLDVEKSSVYPDPHALSCILKLQSNVNFGKKHYVLLCWLKLVSEQSIPISVLCA